MCKNMGFNWNKTMIEYRYIYRKGGKIMGFMNYYKIRFPALVLILCFLVQMVPLWAEAQGDDKPDTKVVAPSAAVSEIDDLFTSGSWGQHPRILANSDDFTIIRKDM